MIKRSGHDGVQLGGQAAALLRPLHQARVAARAHHGDLAGSVRLRSQVLSPAVLFLSSLRTGPLLGPNCINQCYLVLHRMGVDMSAVAGRWGRVVDIGDAPDPTADSSDALLANAPFRRNSSDGISPASRIPLIAMRRSSRASRISGSAMSARRTCWSSCRPRATTSKSAS